MIKKIIGYRGETTMAFEITLDGKVYLDGEELMVLTAEEKKGILGYITLLKMGREVTKIMKI
jgi:hypothetical protein